MVINGIGEFLGHQVRLHNKAQAKAVILNHKKELEDGEQISKIGPV